MSSRVRSAKLPLLPTKSPSGAIPPALGRRLEDSLREVGQEVSVFGRQHTKRPRLRQKIFGGAEAAWSSFVDPTCLNGGIGSDPTTNPTANPTVVFSSENDSNGGVGGVCSGISSGPAMEPNRLPGADSIIDVNSEFLERRSRPPQLLPDGRTRPLRKEPDLVSVIHFAMDWADSPSSGRGGL